jgi:hypothetical protein
MMQRYMRSVTSYKLVSILDSSLSVEDNDTVGPTVLRHHWLDRW